MSLLAEYRNTPAREVLNLVEYLPATSHYKCALAMDEELAQQLLARGHKPTPAKHPPLTEWTPEVAALTNLVDVLNSMRWLYTRAHGGKSQAPPPSPRPLTAMQKARAAQRRENHARLTQRLLGRPPE